MPRGKNPIRNNGADVAELVDARDLKSLDGNVVWVRVPPPAPTAGAERQMRQKWTRLGEAAKAIAEKMPRFD